MKFLIATIASLLLVTNAWSQLRPEYGNYPKPLQLQFEIEDDGRNGKVLSEFSFVDAEKKVWTSPNGAIVNGASIPRPLWAIVGSPWTGRYRQASVIHDHYCDARTETWQSVHRVFYNAMMASGVNEIQAKIMYAAVYRYGPRWNIVYTPNCINCLTVPHKLPQYTPTITESQVQALRIQVESTNPSLDEIEKSADAGFYDELQRLKLGTPSFVN